MKEFHGMYDKLEKFNKRRLRLRMSRSGRGGAFAGLTSTLSKESARLDEFRPPDYGPMFEDTRPSTCAEALTSLMQDLNQKVALKADKVLEVELTSSLLCVQRARLT